MNRKRACIIAVNENFKKRREKNNRIQSEHIETISRDIPQIAAIEREMQKNINAFMDFIMSHDKDEEKFREYKTRSLDFQRQRAELLHEHGYPIDYLDLKYDCPKCKDEGCIGLEQCECYKKELSLEYLRQSNLAPVLEDQTFKDFKLDFYDKDDGTETPPYKKMQFLYQYCQKYVKEFDSKKGNLLFYGNPGCGKSFLSCCIGAELIDKGYFVMYAPIQEMISAFESEKFGKSGEKEDTDVYFDCDLLILDDLGTEFQNSFSDNVLYNVINGRMNKRKPFIVSTNMSLVELEYFYHERIVSRLVYSSASFEFPSVDIRLKKRRRKNRSEKTE